MRAVIQRVSAASVTVGPTRITSIGPGLLVLLGIDAQDGPDEADRLAERVRALRIFEDETGRMNEPLGERELLCVSQFTLCADTRRGNRPSFAAAAHPAVARPLYERFCDRSGAKRGEFGSRMSVELTNDGPVTVIVEAEAAQLSP